MVIRAAQFVYHVVLISKRISSNKNNNKNQESQKHFIFKCSRKKDIIKCRPSMLIWGCCGLESELFMFSFLDILFILVKFNITLYQVVHFIVKTTLKIKH